MISAGSLSLTSSAGEAPRTEKGVEIETGAFGHADDPETISAGIKR
jgi:hypothetical protein